MQATLPQLSRIIEEEGVNVVEIFCCPEYFKEIKNNYMMDIKWTKSPEYFNLDNPIEEAQYYHRDMCYIFDVENDAQKCVRKTLRNEMYYKNFYITSLNEEIIPSHRFPSTQDITENVRVLKHTQKINNRMYWICEKNENGSWVNYIRYNHAPNVEMNTMQNDLERTLTRMPKPKQ
jgi:hypothetical protein